MTLKRISIILILIGVGLFLLVFGSVLMQEINYSTEKAVGIRHVLTPSSMTSNERVIKVPNTDFSVIIPKINAAAPIVDEVDPSDSYTYLKALKEGVAHALGTAYPGEVGNMYLFAHSSDTFYNVGKYNAVFFLIGHLTPGDEIGIFYHSTLYKYTVYDKKVVDPADSQYLGTLVPGEKTLTLQTCYPPGTALKRLVVLAKLEDPNQ